MSEQDKNELIHSLMRLLKRCCGGVGAADMATNSRMAKDNAEFRKLIQGVKALINERDEARRLYCGAVEEIEHGMTNETQREVADFLGWDCFKENINE